jgi:NADP-dependent 3-hydroxy acid dehydrogenase YdfG
MAMDEKRLDGHVALITGAGGGIGRATAVAMGREGASIVGVGRHEDLAGQLQSEIEAAGGSYVHITGDVVEPRTADRASKVALEKYGRIDTLVNNAGVGMYADFIDATVQDYDEMMGINMRGTFLFTHVVVPHMVARGSGLLVQIASQAGIQGFAREAIYCASKHAQVGFSRALRRELQPHGIKVSVICPAAVRTGFAVGRGRDDELLSHEERYLRAEDVANMVVFMATQDSGSRITEVGMMSLGEAL